MQNKKAILTLQKIVFWVFLIIIFLILGAAVVKLLNYLTGG
jgi:hypothetical protein